MGRLKYHVQRVTEAEVVKHHLRQHRLFEPAILRLQDGHHGLQADPVAAPFVS